MSAVRAVGEVARWELVCYVKLNQQLIGLVMTFLILMGISFFGRLGSDAATIELAVIGAEYLPTMAGEAGRFELRPRPAADEARLRSEVEDRELAGLLVLRPGGDGELFSRQDPGWRGELERELTLALTLHRLQEAGIEPETLAMLRAPFQLDVAEAAPRAGRTERMAALIALGLLMLGLLSGVLSLAPPTSSAVMPARLLVTEVPAWEVALAAVFLVVLTYVVRRAAAKIFRLGMLMYGKEPAWAEVRRWLREA